MTLHSEREVAAPSANAPFAPSASSNRLLRTLPADEYATVSQELHVAPIKAKQILHKQGGEISAVYFPGGGAYSLIKSMADGSAAEIATVGNEGMSGASVFFGDRISTGDVIAQFADPAAHLMPVDAFVREMGRHGAFYNLIIRYSQAFMTQIMQTTVCNGLHSAEQRCCRWLLTTHDRVRKDEFPLTHEFLANMLGVRRPTVTLIAGQLQEMALIHHRRGIMTILDRIGLEKLSCECYETVKANFARLLPELPQVR